MGSKVRVNPPRVVLDTNIVVSALVFRRGRLVWLRRAWQTACFVPLVNHDTASELVCLLGYPKFQLTQTEQKILLGEFLPFAEVVSSSDAMAGLPKVSDPADRMFLALARHAKADALVSDDADLQSVRSKSWRIPILSPSEFSGWLDKLAGEPRR